MKQLIYLGPAETLETVKENLSNEFDIHLALDDDTVDRYIGQADVVLDAYMRVRFPAERIASAPNLKLFVTATTGADHVDADALAKRDIPLLTLKGQRDVLRNITPAAEHSWLLLMACARGLRSAVHTVLDGEWDRNKHPGIMLRGKTIGIIGCGRIGEWMSRYATAFGMKCLGFDPYLSVWPETIQHCETLSQLLPESDFVSVHVPLGDETRGLLGPEEFQMMKPGAVLVNTSRGEIIDETELLNALTSGHVAAAGLDVLVGEPETSAHPLVEYARSHENLVITPHIGGFSPDAVRFVVTFSCNRIKEYFANAKRN